jgi:hypothetical protein
LLALFGLGSLSELSPLCAQERKLNVTTIWLALAICAVVLTGAAAIFLARFERSSTML